VTSVPGVAREPARFERHGRRKTSNEAAVPAVMDALESTDPVVDGRLRTARARARPIVVVLDGAGLIATFVGGWAVVRVGLTTGVASQGHLGLWVIAFLPAYLLGLSAYGVYRRERRRLFASSFPDLVSLAHGLAVGGIVTLVVSHLLRRVAGAPPPSTSRASS
jgi:hypothetical protein